MVKGAISRDDILKTLEEYDQLGRRAFLDRYGYGEATAYLLVHEGKEYDSKAIAGVAHKHRHGMPLGNGEFSGGVGSGQAVAWLRREGFTVRSSRSPEWTRDEIILACDLVARNGWRGLDADDPRTAELCELLQLLGGYPAEERTGACRDRNGVARKTVEMAAQHPDHRGKPAGGRLERDVLHDFLERPAEMAQAAQLLRKGLQLGTLQPVLPDDDDAEDDVSAPEGRVLYRRHRTRERNKALRKKKIAAVLKRGRPLACESCGFDFGAVYGERGVGYIECHHVVPLHEAGEGETKLADLALICSNCHRMIHRTAPWPTPAELRALIQRQAWTKTT
jgi:5-methylcytosine-specific restriction enzyme A